MNEKKFDDEALARKPLGALSDAEAAHLYRLGQARDLIAASGAKTMDGLVGWVDRQKAKGRTR